MKYIIVDPLFGGNVLHFDVPVGSFVDHLDDFLSSDHFLSCKKNGHVLISAANHQTRITLSKLLAASECNLPITWERHLRRIWKPIQKEREGFSVDSLTE